VKKLYEYFDVGYFIKFIILFLCLNYFNLFYIGVTAEGGSFYSFFLAHYLNYVDWIRSLVLHGSNSLAHLFGMNTYVLLPYKVKLANGLGVEMVYSCVGLGNMSFWIAFVVTHSASVKGKVIWMITGLLSIYVINCLRVCVLLAFLESNTNLNNFGDHHGMYNIVAYALIAFLIYLFTKQSGAKEDKVLSV
jgi:exosortase/archaeosortase family protein